MKKLCPGSDPGHNLDTFRRNMAEKFYAVKKGEVPGIYRTWDECKEMVSGFSGAEYKSFKTLEEAEAYLGVAPGTYGGTEEASSENKISLEEYLEQNRESEAIAYVDGSFNAANMEYAYGLVLYANGELYEDCGSGFDEDMSAMHNVAGEIEGAMHAMKYCLEHRIASLDIYYDYKGIECWAIGEWKTNRDGTKAYKEFYDSIKDILKVTFHKVKGHSGDIGNDRADELAKQALGII